MNYRGSTLLHKPIYSLDTGKKLDQTVFLVLDPETQLVTDVVIRSSALEFEQTLTLNAIRYITHEAIWIDSASHLIEAVPPTDRILIGNPDSYLPVYSEHGYHLGFLLDVYFNHPKGSLTEIDIFSGHRLNDRWRLEKHQILELHFNQVIIHDYATNFLSHHQSRQPYFPIGTFSTLAPRPSFS